MGQVRLPSDLGNITHREEADEPVIHITDEAGDGYPADRIQKGMAAASVFDARNENRICAWRN